MMVRLFSLKPTIRTGDCPYGVLYDNEYNTKMFPCKELFSKKSIFLLCFMLLIINSTIIYFGVLTAGVSH